MFISIIAVYNPFKLVHAKPKYVQKVSTFLLFEESTYTLITYNHTQLPTRRCRLEVVGISSVPAFSPGTLSSVVFIIFR